MEISSTVGARWLKSLEEVLKKEIWEAIRGSKYCKILVSLSSENLSRLFSKSIATLSTCASAWIRSSGANSGDFAFSASLLAFSSFFLTIYLK